MDIQFPQILFQLINFSVVVGGVVYLLYKPIQKILDERMNKIAEGQKAAQKSIEEKDKLEELKIKAEKEVSKESADVVAQAKKKAEKQAQEILSQAKKDASLVLEKLKKDLENDRKSQLEKDKKQMIQAISEAVFLVSKEKVDSKADEKLIASELDKVLAKI